MSMVSPGVDVDLMKHDDDNDDNDDDDETPVEIPEIIHHLVQWQSQN